MGSVENSLKKVNYDMLKFFYIKVTQVRLKTKNLIVLRGKVKK